MNVRILHPDAHVFAQTAAALEASARRFDEELDHLDECAQMVDGPGAESARCAFRASQAHLRAFRNDWIDKAYGFRTRLQEAAPEPDLRPRP